jgi:hypothetical protein
MVEAHLPLPPYTRPMILGCVAVTAGMAVIASSYRLTIFSPSPEYTSRPRFMLPVVQCDGALWFWDHCALKTET